MSKTQADKEHDRFASAVGAYCKEESRCACPYCGGDVEVEVTTDTNDPHLVSPDGECRMYAHCEHCNRRWVEVHKREYVLRGIEELPAADLCEQWRATASGEEGCDDTH